MAKNRETAQLLTSLFRLRKVHKTYLAICDGEIEKNSGEWNDELIRYDNGKKIIEPAKTIFKVLDKNTNSSLVEMKPITGRKHQLRKQLFNIGHSIYGDKKYSLKEIAQLPQIIISPSRPNLKGSHDSWFAKKGLKRNILMSVPSFSAAATIIEATNTIAFLPAKLLPESRLVPIEIAENPPKFDVIVAWHPRSTNNPLHQWLLILLDNIFYPDE